MNITDQVTEAEQRILEGITSLHEQLIEANNKAAEWLQELRIPAPDAEQVVEPGEAVAHYYDFAGKLLETNHAFAEQIVAAWAPAAKSASSGSASKGK